MNLTCHFKASFIHASFRLWLQSLTCGRAHNSSQDSGRSAPPHALSDDEVAEPAEDLGQSDNGLENDANGADDGSQVEPSLQRRQSGSAVSGRASTLEPTDSPPLDQLSPKRTIADRISSLVAPTGYRKIVPATETEKTSPMYIYGVRMALVQGSEGESDAKKKGRWYCLAHDACADNEVNFSLTGSTTVVSNHLNRQVPPIIINAISIFFIVFMIPMRVENLFNKMVIVFTSND